MARTKRTYVEAMSKDLQAENEGDGQSDGEQNTSGSCPPRRRGRSLGTRLCQIEGHVKIKTNTDGAAICENARLLSDHISNIVGNGRTIPLNVNNWKYVKDTAKKQALLQIFSRFEFDNRNKAEEWLTTKCNLLWKDAKHNLKEKHFDAMMSEAAQLLNCPDHISAEQWEGLVKYWRSPEGKAKSMQGSENRKKVTLKHRAGTHSYAVLREKERKKNGGVEPDPIDFFKLIFTPKGSLTVDQAAQRVVAAFEMMISLVPEDTLDATARGQVLIEVLGGPSHGRIPMAGTIPPRVRQRHREDSVASAAMATAERVQRENEELRKRIDNIENEHKVELQRLVEQMAQERRKEMELMMVQMNAMKCIQDEYIHQQMVSIRSRNQSFDPYLPRAQARQYDDDSDETQA